MMGTSSYLGKTTESRWGVWTGDYRKTKLLPEERSWSKLSADEFSTLQETRMVVRCGVPAGSNTAGIRVVSRNCIRPSFEGRFFYTYFYPLEYALWLRCQKAGGENSKKSSWQEK